MVAAFVVHTMTDQEIVDHFARLAKPRLLELLKLTIPHLYDPRPGRADVQSETNDSDVGLNRPRLASVRAKDGK